jgi:hypothetical protein
MLYIEDRSGTETKEKVLGSWSMKTIESMKVVGYQIVGMERDLKDTLMAMFTKESLRREKPVVKASTTGKMGRCMMGNG